MSENRKQTKTEIEKEMMLYESYIEKQKREERLEIESRNTTSEPRPINPEWMQREEHAITFDVLKSCILTRNFISQNIYKPFLSQIKGCFVRMSFPNGYAICRIIDIVYGKEYSFPVGGLTFVVDKYLVIKHGDNQIKIPVTFLSNSAIIEDEFNVQRKSEFDCDIVKDYTRVKKLFERSLSRDEQRKMDDEKRKFLCSLKKRCIYFKTDLIRKRRDAIHDRRKDFANELHEVLKLFENEDEPLSSIELNELGRKYHLNVPGGEIDKVEIIKKKDL